MPDLPPCKRLGRHCRELEVTLSISHLTDDDAATRDAVATWLLGRTERISFGRPYTRGRRVVVDAVVHVPCKYLETAAGGEGRAQTAKARCRAHGFVGALPPTSRPTRPRALRHPDSSTTLVHRGRRRRLDLAARPLRPRSLPVLHHGGNPCRDAPCRTADNRRGAACCRDLTLEIVAPAFEPRSGVLEALLGARRAPYLCKTERVSVEMLESEVISACGYLADDEITCVLHGRVRPDGTAAKPYICADWPDLGPDDEGHPGCRLLPARPADTSA